MVAVRTGGFLYSDPDGISDLDAANIIYSYGSAHYGLIRRQLESGNFASDRRYGRCGACALELGNLLGARVIAVWDQKTKRACDAIWCRHHDQLHNRRIA